MTRLYNIGLSTGARMSHAHAFDYHFHIQACAQGRSQALHSLFLHEAPIMLALADAYLVAEARARQAVSDTFMLIWRHASHYPGQPSQARAWLYSILRHRLKYDPREQAHPDPIRWHSLPELSADILAALNPGDKRVLQAAYCLGLQPQALAQLTAHAAADTLRQTLTVLVQSHGLAEPTLSSIDQQALAAYVLGVTDEQTRQRAESLLQAQPAAAKQVLHWESVCLAFADTLAPAPAAHTLLGAICQQLQLPAPAPLPLKPARPPSPVATSASATPKSQQNHVQTEAPTPLLRVPSNQTPSTPTSEPISGAAKAQSAQGEAPSASPSPTPSSSPAAAVRPSTAKALPDDKAAADTPRSRHTPQVPQQAKRAEPLFAETAGPQTSAAGTTRTTPNSVRAKHETAKPALLPWVGGLAVVLALVFAGYKGFGGGQIAAPVAPPPTLQQIAVLQAPGSSSTPGWLLTQDSAQQLDLKPLVSIELAPAEGVYLWTQSPADLAPRLLARVMPDTPLRLQSEQIGVVQAGQIFEMTLEPIREALPAEPEGPVLFIGRAVNLNEPAPLVRPDVAGAPNLRNP